MSRLSRTLTLSLALVLAPLANAQTTIGFEGLPDATVLTTQLAGFVFTRTIVLGSGISLNEFEFPPHAGSNVASDDGGTMQIAFSGPMSAVSGFFTYAAPLTLTAFDAGGLVVASVQSLFASNLALSGMAGSHPNELLAVVAPAGIARVVIAGAAGGGSFTLDDLAVTPIPEPATAVLLLAGMLGVAAFARRGASL